MVKNGSNTKNPFNLIFISSILCVMIYAESKNFELFFQSFMPEQNAILFSYCLSIFGIVGSFYDNSKFTKWIYGFCIGSLFFLSYGNMLLKSYNDSMNSQIAHLIEPVPDPPTNKSNRGKCYVFESDDPNRSKCFSSEDAISMNFEKRFADWEKLRDGINERNSKIKSSPTLETMSNFILQFCGVSFISILLAILNARLSGILSDEIRDMTEIIEPESIHNQPVYQTHQQSFNSSESMDDPIPENNSNKKRSGRKKSIDYGELVNQIRPLRESGISTKTICESLGISQSTFYRSLRTFP